MIFFLLLGFIDLLWSGEIYWQKIFMMLWSLIRLIVFCSLFILEFFKPKIRQSASFFESAWAFSIPQLFMCRHYILYNFSCNLYVTSSYHHLVISLIFIIFIYAHIWFLGSFYHSLEIIIVVIWSENLINL